VKKVGNAIDLRVVVRLYAGSMVMARFMAQVPMLGPAIMAHQILTLDGGGTGGRSNAQIRR
jgi:hypothetical protein